MQEKHQFRMSVLALAVLGGIGSSPVMADNYLGTSAVEADTPTQTPVGGVTSGDNTVQANDGNTQIYSGTNQAIYLINSDDIVVPNPTTATMAVTSAQTRINSTGTLISGTLDVRGTISNGAGTVTIGDDLSVTGATSINASANNATNINTGTSTGAVTIGGSANTTNLNSATNNIGVSSGYATANNIGTNSAFSSANNIGNTNAASTVTARGGNSTLSLVNGTAGLTSGSNGFTTTSASQTLSANSATLATQLNNVGDAASRQNIAGAVYVNRLEGNTLINGNTYINGTLAYSSNTSATTTVTSGTSVVAGATQATTGQMTIV